MSGELKSRILEVIKELREEIQLDWKIQKCAHTHPHHCMSLEAYSEHEQSQGVFWYGMLLFSITWLEHWLLTMDQQ